MIPPESALQTSFFPSQQFWDAFTVPLPPQMLPGGLQLWPPVQVFGAPDCFGSHVTPYPDGRIWSGVPPQHSSRVSQELPVIRHPPAGLQAVAPVAARSVHTRVQQLELPEHGLPSAVQPPDGGMQRPGEPVAEHRPVQQSWLR
jgi:hypothetical protein